ncbi:MULTISPECIES: TIR domain-containing protein [unclassified Caballeronia]|uniref:TIR domain-containing protein n=1 Tax=unclassified Caballeronia TaxID=2646786 RepID=UPI0028626EF2|nr:MULTISPECIES: TIR domain-containing protein [unclassified Caballeronia]MDR5752554.1 TIR domain-containing protein [Caballeronia sp. LZ024]MDR5841710.1 TIR domain-containing protein [Caballeronia sp. LZ031]
MSPLHAVVSSSNARTADFVRWCVTQIGRARPSINLGMATLEASRGTPDDAKGMPLSCASFVVMLTQSNETADPHWIAAWQRALDSRAPITVVLGTSGLALPPELKPYTMFDLSSRDASLLNALARHLDSKLAISGLPTGARAQAADDNNARYGWFRVPSYFEDRTRERKKIADFIIDEWTFLIAVYGRHGVGKRTLVARALQETACGKDVSRPIYIDAAQSPSTVFTDILQKLTDTLDDEAKQRVEKTREIPQISVERTLEEIARHIGGKPRLVVIERLDEIVERTSNTVDHHMAQFLRYIASGTWHPFKVVLTTSVVPHEFRTLNLPHFRPVPLDHGLPSPDVRKVLDALDNDGCLGLKHSSDVLLARVLSVTHGYPLAIERFVTILMNDPATRPDSLIDRIERAIASAEERMPDYDDFISALVGAAFKRCSKDEQTVTQALAVYETPVPKEAVLFLLEKWGPEIELQSVIRQLLLSHLVSQDGDKLTLHRVDREYALSKLAERHRVALRRRAAAWFRRLELPARAWHTETDLNPHFAQFNIFLRTRDYAHALHILDSIAPFLNRRGYFVRLAELSRALRKEEVSNAIACKALSYEADAHWYMGDVKKALGLQEQADALLFRSNASEEDRLDSKIRLIRFGFYLRSTDKTLDAARDCVQAILRAGHDDPRRGAFAWRNMLVCEFELGHLTEALACCESEHACAKASGDAELLQNSLVDASVVHAEMGELKVAEELLRQALSISDESQSPRAEALVSCELASCLASLGKLEEAARFACKARELNQRIEAHAGAALCMRTHAAILLDQGRIQEAESSADQACTEIKAFDYHASRYVCMRAEIELARRPRSTVAREMLRRLDTEGRNEWTFNTFLGIVSVGNKSIDGVEDSAKEAFEQALKRADRYLKHCNQNVSALGERALALAGLAVCGDKSKMPLAVQAYKVAFERASSNCMRKRLIRRFNALVRADAGEIGLDLMDMIFEQESPKVFISYSWDEEGNALVDKIEQDMPLDLHLIRDRNRMRVGDSIDRFMQQIGKARLTIVVISDASLRSEYCMTELLYMWEGSKRDCVRFTNRMVLLVVPRLEISSDEERRVYSKIWADKYKDALNHARGNEDADVVATQRKLKDLAENTVSMLKCIADTLMADSTKTTIEAVISRLLDSR